MAEVTDAHRYAASEVLAGIDGLRSPVRTGDAIAQQIADAEARGRAAALAEVADLVRDARCSLADPGLRMAWGRTRRQLLDEALDTRGAVARA